MKQKSAAVIGAGISGISAARKLSSAGWRVVIFEKSRGFGGRCSTKRLGGCIVDHGVPVFTLDSPLFSSAVLDACGSWIRRIDASVLCLPDETEFTPRLHYHCAGNSYVARELSAGLDVRSGTPIDSIASPVIDGEVFDLVISTAPWPQTAALAGVADDSPSPYRPCLALVLVFESAWPGRTKRHFAITGTDEGVIRWTHCDNHKEGRVADGYTALVIHGSETFSRRYLEEATDVWSRLLADAAMELWEISSSTPFKSHPHRWRYAALAETPVLKPLPEHVVFIGESQTGGTAESAWERGATIEV